MSDFIRRFALAWVIGSVAVACSSDSAQSPSQMTAGTFATAGTIATAAVGGGAGAAAAPAAGTTARAGSSGPAAVSGTGGARASTDAGVAGAPSRTDAMTPSMTDDAGEPEPKPDAAVSGGMASFSDSFEQGATLDTARYEVVTKDCSGTGMASIDTASGHSGKQSLRIAGGGGYCNHVFVRPKALTNMLPAPLYARVFVKVSNALTENHVTFIALHDMREDKDLRLGGQKQVVIWNRESDDATLPELSPTGVMASSALTPGDWHCLEWSIDGSMKTLQTWLDDRPIPGLTADAQPTPDVDTQWLRKADWQPQPIDVRLGWESYGNDTNTLWFDDFALGTSRIRCGS